MAFPNILLFLLSWLVNITTRHFSFRSPILPAPASFSKGCKVRTAWRKTAPHPPKMTDQIARGEELEKKAEKKLNGWGLFGSKYEDAADLYDKAANSYKLAKSCNITFYQLYRSLSIWVRFGSKKIREITNCCYYLLLFFC